MPRCSVKVGSADGTQVLVFDLSLTDLPLMALYSLGFESTVSLPEESGLEIHTLEGLR